MTGISSIEEVNDVAVYPNPAHNVLYISIHHSQRENVKMVFADMLGKKLMEKKIVVGGDPFAFNLPESFKTGIYILTLQSESKVVTRKIILN